MRRNAAIFLVIAAITFYGCEPVPPTVDLVQHMAVQTNLDKTANFSGYHTYTMPLDTIGQISNTDPQDSLITGDYGVLISRQVKSNLDKKGYARVDLNQNPDLGINVFVVHNFTMFQTINYFGPFGGFPGYFYPGYYGYGGYYGYPYISTYASNTASLVIEMVDLKNKDDQNNARVVWTAYIGDLITTEDTFAKSQEAVEQAFAQSPYLGR